MAGDDGLDGADADLTTIAAGSTCRRAGLCAICGYDLTGLAEPRCPECGEVDGPEAEQQATESWFCAWPALLVLNRPPYFLRNLRTPRCRRVVAARFALWFLLPWILLFVYVLALSSLAFISTRERWLEAPTKPGVKIDTDWFASREHALGETQWRPARQRRALLLPGPGYLNERLASREMYLVARSPPAWASAGVALLVSSLLISIGLTYLMFNVPQLTLHQKPGWAILSWLAIAHAVLISCTVVGLTSEAFQVDRGELLGIALPVGFGEWTNVGLLAYLVAGALFVGRAATGHSPRWGTAGTKNCLAYAFCWFALNLIGVIAAGAAINP